MADTLITPSTGSLTVAGRKLPGIFPVYQTNGTDTTDGARFGPIQLNGTDQSGGAVFGPYALLGGSREFIAATGSVGFAGQQPTLRSSLIVAATGSLSVAGQGASVADSSARVISGDPGAVLFNGLQPTVTLDLTTAIVGNASISLLPHSLTTSGVAEQNVGALFLLRHSLSATGERLNTGNASASLLAHRITAGGNEGLDKSLPLHTLSASGVHGSVGTASITLFRHSILSGSLTLGPSGDAQIRLLPHAITASAIHGNLGTLQRNLLAHKLSSTAVSGNAGAAAIKLLVHELASIAYPTGAGTAQINLLRHFVEAAGFSLPEENYRAWVMNTRNGAVSEYDNFHFNSLTKFGEVYLAAGPEGIFVLDGDTDDGEEIAAVLRTGQLTYGRSVLKRLPRLYVSYNTDGDIVFRTINQESGPRSYLLVHNGVEGEQQRRVPVGRGPKSQRWQLEVANRDGADFELSSILVYPINLRRRIQ